MAAFADYAQARGLFIDPARVRKPRDKARVENQVAYVRESWFEGEDFTGLDDARLSARHWSGEVAGGRVHGTTRRVPREVYEAEEKGSMSPVPDKAFDVPRWGVSKVHADHHIDFMKGLYSVPTLYLNKRVRVRADKVSVRIYFGTELIKTHPRVQPGGRSTDVRDYPTGKGAYALRSVDAVLVKAKDKGHHIGLVRRAHPRRAIALVRMRQAYALLGLCDKYGVGKVEALCQSALAFDVVDVAGLPGCRRLRRAPRRRTRPEARSCRCRFPRLASRARRSSSGPATAPAERTVHDDDLHHDDCCCARARHRAATPAPRACSPRSRSGLRLRRSRACPSRTCC